MHEAYEVIAKARALVKDGRPGEISERTKAGYKVKAKRLMSMAREMQGDELENLIACAKQTRSISTWYSQRAALLFTLRVGMEKLLSEQDKAQRALKALQVPAEDERWERWQKMVFQLENHSQWHQRLKEESGPAIEERKARHSKRKDMKGLPDDWREALISRLPKYRQAALTEAVTGCRPDELVKGVKLSIVGDNLIAEIQGSKVTEKSGQPWRRLVWNVASESPLVAMLVDEVRNGLSIAKIADAKTYSGAVRAAGEREWPRRKKKLSPYCFRHAAASDMKAAGVEDVDISAALGHCVDKAKSYYGQWQAGRVRGGVSPAKIEAARPVRVLKSKPLISSNKGVPA